MLQLGKGAASAGFACFVVSTIQVSLRMEKKMHPWDTPTTGAAAVRVPAGEGISDPQEWTEDTLTPRVPSQPQPQLWGYPRVFSFQIRADLNANAQTAHSIMRVSCCTSILEKHKTSLR